MKARPYVELIVILPMGPTCRLDYVADTLDSVRFYTNESRKIIVIDDSGTGAGRELSASQPDLEVLANAHTLGKAGLYRTLAKGFRYALARYSFDVALRIDSDALIIGPRPESDARRYFQTHPGVGVIGSYLRDSNGVRRDFGWSREQLLREASFGHLRERPSRLAGWLFLRATLAAARQHGYVPGEFCQGGAYFISSHCLSTLRRRRLLGRKAIGWTSLAEDHLLGLLAHAAGFGLGDFATGSLPMGIRWLGLPSAPEDLVRQGKKVVHSTRFWQDMDEVQIRDHFRSRREGGQGA